MAMWRWIADIPHRFPLQSLPLEGIRAQKQAVYRDTADLYIHTYHPNDNT
jgi:hypothetical protein